MTRFQKLSLLIGALVLVLLVALIAVVALKPTTTIAPDDLTMTYAVEWAATNAATLDAIADSAWQTAIANTNATNARP